MQGSFSDTGREYIFRGSFIFFLIVWSAFSIYSLAAFFYPALYFTYGVFWTFIFILDVLLICLFAAWWYLKKEKSLQQRMLALAVAMFSFAYWGLFALYFFNFIEFNDRQFRYIASLFIWENIVAAVAVGFAIGLAVRFIDNLSKQKIPIENIPPMYTRISKTPLKIACI